jgi:glucosamine--fructose-6-phosphate aminotransferase (isomerizing)
VAAGVLESIYQGDPVAAILKFTVCLKGSYSFCMMFEDHPGDLYAIRNISPLVVADTRSGSFVASDLTALIPYTRQYFVVPENHIVKLTSCKVHLYNPEQQEEVPELTEADWNMDAAMKNGFPHFMLKEIHEQPDALKNTILPRLVKGLPDFGDDKIPDSVLKQCTEVHIAACGTAMHAGIAAKAIMEPLLRIPVTVSIASEFRYEEPLIDCNTLVIIISQSGETIDTLAALRLAKTSGAAVLSVVNVKGSAIARESDYVLYTHAGPEIAVASTKAYSVQLAALYMVCGRMAFVRGNYDRERAEDFIKELLDAIPAMEVMIEKKDEVKALVTHLMNKPDVFFIGRGLDYAFSLEGALKLKEISYIHAEACAAGELKHGTIALITDQVPVIAIATQEKIFSKTVSNIREIKARGAFVILLTKEKSKIEPGVADVQINIPEIGDRFTVFPIAAVLQLIAYYASVGKDLDVDQPRNLAKSVTVE